MFENNYEMFKAYANSKLALLMFAEELQHRLDREKSKVIVNSANPGEQPFWGTAEVKPKTGGGCSEEARCGLAKSWRLESRFSA